MDHDKEKEFAYQMLLNEHKRWNQWSLFFLGPLALLFTAGFNKGAIEFLGETTIWMALFILGMGWIVSVIAIKRSTFAWAEAVKGLDSAQSLSAWALYKAATKRFDLWDDFKPLTRIIKVTNVLLFYGVALTMLAVYKLMTSIVSTLCCAACC